MTIKLNTVRDPSACNDVRIEATLAVDTGRGYPKRFGVGFVPEGDEGRKFMHGPMVPGPWAYAFGLCSVIDNHGGTGAERARNLKAKTEFDVAEGDKVEIDGVLFTVAIRRNGGEPYIDLAAAAA